MKPNYAAKSILKAFTSETSFLSESAEIAPDENSYVQIRETNFNGASQSSVAIEGLLDKASKEILLSQDVVRSSSLSLVDPLCSIVPCSISSEDTNSTRAQNQNNKETDFERDFITPVEMRNSGNISNLNVQIQCGDGQVTHIVNEDSEGTVRRQLTSLKTYSTFLPNSVAISDEGSLQYNNPFQSQFSRGHIALNQNMCCIGTPDKGGSKQIPLFNFVCVPLSGRENEEFCETMVNGKLIEKLKKKNTPNHETTRDVSDLPVHFPKGRVQPVLLNHGVRRRLQASKPSAVDSDGKEHSKQKSGMKDHIRLQPSERPQNVQPDYKNSHDGHFPARKRVRFSEVEIQIEANKNAREPHFSNRNCKI